jgi:radical SAM protein with 4Fe4S-binding SPASM domain
MSEKLFKSIISQGKDMGVNRYLPFLNGEPFAFTKIFKWLDYMNEQNVQVHLYTNASLLTKAKIDRLVSIGCVRFIYCSLNAATKETYNKVMPGLDFDKTVKNIKYLISKRNCTVRVGMVVNEYTQNEKELFIKQWGRKSKITRFENWGGQKHDITERTSNRLMCRQLHNHMAILWDGRVCLCCFDYEGKIVLGDLKKQTMKQIWENSRSLRYKNQKLKFDNKLCKDCNFNLKGPV